jgi:hypothetical protein
MKNIRGCKELGIGTVLLTGSADEGTYREAGDMPDAADPAVDVVMRTCAELKQRIPTLWSRQFPG